MEEDIIRIEEIKKEYSTMDGLKEYVKAIENVLNRLEQNERVIEEMAECINNLGWSDLDNNKDIIEHFRKRVESNE